MRQDILKLIGSIYRANKSTRKSEHLDGSLDDFELPKLKVRLCVELDYKQELVALCEEINTGIFQPGALHRLYCR